MRNAVLFPPIMLARVVTCLCTLSSAVYCVQAIGTLAQSLAEYFGGAELVPPLVNGTYGGETSCLGSARGDLWLTCSAKSSVKWITLPGLVRFYKEGPFSETYYFAAVFRQTPT